MFHQFIARYLWAGVRRARQYRQKASVWSGKFDFNLIFDIPKQKQDPEFKKAMNILFKGGRGRRSKTPGWARRWTIRNW